MSSIVKEFFSGMEEAILREHLLIGDYMASSKNFYNNYLDPADPDSVDP